MSGLQTRHPLDSATRLPNDPQLSRAGQLENLLEAIFGDRPLRLSIILGKYVEYHEITMLVAAPTNAPRIYYHEVALALDRSGLLVIGFFIILRREVHGRDDEIDGACLHCLGCPLEVPPAEQREGANLQTPRYRSRRTVTRLAGVLALLLVLAGLLLFAAREDSSKPLPTGLDGTDAAAGAVDGERQLVVEPEATVSTSAAMPDFGLGGGPLKKERRKSDKRKSRYDSPQVPVTRDGDP